MSVHDFFKSLWFFFFKLIDILKRKTYKTDTADKIRTFEFILTVVRISTIISPNAADRKRVIGESKVKIKHIKMMISYKFV